MCLSECTTVEVKLWREEIIKEAKHLMAEMVCGSKRNKENGGDEEEDRIVTKVEKDKEKLRNWRE